MGSDIVELKCLAKPPQGVMAVLHCVQILLDKDPDGGWAAAKRMLGDVTFLKTLQEYRPEDVTDAQRQSVQSKLESDVAFVMTICRRCPKQHMDLCAGYVR